jgi:transposase InsO family protein
LNTKVFKPFDIIHSDVWGPAPVQSFYGHRYFVLFVDDFTRFTWVYFLKNKSDIYQNFHHFEKHIERQFNSKIKAFHSDWGGEFSKTHQTFSTHRH